MIKRSKPPNKYSLKKINQLNAEAPIRKQLAYRSHGKPIETIERYKRNDGKVYQIHRVRCIGGICECGCKRRGNLEPHEKVRRSKGGILSLQNTIMILRECHRRLDGRSVKLKWITQSNSD